MRSIGNPNANYIMGLTNSFVYKGFELSVLLTGAFDVYNYTAFTSTSPNEEKIIHSFNNL